jgi:hypothetical protein
MHPHPAPAGWPFPVWKGYPYKPTQQPLQEAPW